MAEIQPGKIVFEIVRCLKNWHVSLHSGVGKLPLRTTFVARTPDWPVIRRNGMKLLNCAKRRRTKLKSRPCKGPLRPAYAKATQQLNNTGNCATRRDIARAKTILVEKQNAEKSAK